MEKPACEAFAKRCLPALFSVGLGAGLLLALAAKAWVDYDPSWDSWWYHLPFAARLWGMVPQETYEFGVVVAKYYNGLPLTMEWLQGLLWFVSGRVQAANFLCLGALAAYCVYVARRFGVEFTVLLVGLLAVPLVMIHATSSYIDLPGNLAVAGMLLLLWQWWSAPERMKRIDAYVGAALLVVAVNSKYQLWPVSGAVAGCAGLLAWRGKLWRSLRGADVAVAAAVLVLVALVPVKNMVHYGTAVYPLEISSADKKSRREPYSIGSDWWLRNIMTQRWLISVFELDRAYGRWSIDQLDFHNMPGGNRKGGYHGVYVLFQLGLLAWLSRGLERAQRRKLWLFFAGLTCLSAMMPKPQELRYYMFWIIWLVSANLMLLGRKGQGAQRAVFGACVGFMLLVGAMTQWQFLWPQGIGRDEVFRKIKQNVPYPFVADHFEPEQVEKARQKGAVCLISKQPFTFFYTSYFNPPGQYKVYAGYFPSDCPEALREAH